MVAYAGRSNNQAQAKYSSYEEQCLVVVQAMATFRCYLFGSLFTLVTYYQPLKWFMEFDRLTGKLARWAFITQEYEFEVKHQAGIVNQAMDGLSRNPSASDLDTTKAHWHEETNLETMYNWHVVSFIYILANGCHKVYIMSSSSGSLMHLQEFENGT